MLELVGDFLDLSLFHLSGTDVTVATLLSALLVLLFAWWVSRLARSAVSKFLVGEDTDQGTAAVLRRLLHYAIMLVGIGMALDTVGLNLSALFAAGAVFAVGLGFAMQNIAQNFVSGVILLVERTIKPGDVIMVNDTIVKVSQMGIRATMVRGLDDEEIIVPNSSLVQSAVTNFTLQDSFFRIRVPVGVVYSSDLKLVHETLTKTAKEFPDRTQAREPVVLLREFADSAVNFEVSIWIDDPWGGLRAKSTLHHSVWWALKEVGVVIAFPQLDVHFDPNVNRSLELISSQGA